MIDYARIYAAQLLELLGPSERAVDAISVDYAAGRERPDDDHPDSGAGSMAGMLAKAARLTPFLVLTERRLLVVDELGDPERQAVTWAVPLELVAVVRHDPRPPVDLGRILVGFDDSSLVRLRAGLLLPFAARRFARAFADLQGNHRPRRGRG